ncbi:hypothetical protein BT63DRAFT_450604 [Microthyrium microscopicum]|uniref:Uncharacterized protein n=1 Tax=Microthyrium microscopicum TaxID=703497 RepID=A0A6A6UNC9_9PEZI|nr:hypothetical protein BT63DRAFT_450604 [Microthyrium microscopicum]
MRSFQILSILSTLTLATATPFSSFVERATCPIAQCFPFPEQNKCDITTSCTSTGAIHSGGTTAPDYCACRAGYKADPAVYPPSDGSVQMRLVWPGQEGRVFVKPGVPCNTLCDHWELGAQGCQEVPLVTNGCS